MSYEEDRARLIEARATIDELEDKVLPEAVERGEAYILNAWYFHSEYHWPFLTLGEAVERACDDCSPVKITGPDGIIYETDGTPRV